MFSINVTSNVQEVIRKLSDLQKEQVPFALAHALTMTAQRVKDAQVREMRDVFDRPTPYTLDSLFTRPATKTNLTAFVWLKSDTSKGTPADKYLMPQIKGGERRLKRFEKALQRVGALPPDYVAVPGEAAKLDSYGNMSRGQIVQILSYFQAFPEAGYRANITAARKVRLARGSRAKQGIAYFVGRPGGGKAPLGVWQRTQFAAGSAIKPVLIFVPAARYEKLFDFYYVAQQTIERDLLPQFAASLQAALASAKP